MGKKDQTSSKKIYLEIMRILAIFAVIFCHTGTSGIHHYLETTNIVNYWFGIFLASISEFCIPLFFMISGALLLNREDSIRYVYRHRVLRMVLATLLAVLIQYLWNYFENPAIGLPLSSKFFLQIAYEGSASTTHWFLYSYLSFLIFLPFLQKLVKAIPDTSWFLYLFLTYAFLAEILPIFEFYQSWGKTPLALPIPDFLINAMIGYFLENRCGNYFNKGKNVLIAAAVTLSLLLINMHINHLSLSHSQFAAYRGIFASVYAFAVFVTVKYICIRWPVPKILGKIYSFFGAGVFGTYLLEGILRPLLFPIYIFLNTRIQAYPAAFVWILACVLTGCILSNLFKKIPWVGKII